MLCSTIPVRAYAEELSRESKIEIEKQLEVEKDIVDISSAIAGNLKTVEEIIAQSKFTQRQGHAFAAEQGNNFIDGTLLYSGSYAIIGTMVIRTSYKLSDNQQVKLTNDITKALTQVNIE